jgi:RNA polymerase sigma factor (sigma-70 family)
MQHAVATCAYPVRLNPQCLRKLALHRRRQWQSRTSIEGPSTSEPVPEAVRQVHAAMRHAVSLDAVREEGCRLIDLISDADTDPAGRIDSDEILRWLMSRLRPRERLVVSLRFGLGGREPLTLSRVGRLLGVSRERIRQIQEHALNKLRRSPPPRTGSIAIQEGR